MGAALPDELIAADRTLDALLSRVSFSRHLNPENVPHARAAFEHGAAAPPFRYAPTAWADDALAELASVRVPVQHPLGPVVRRAIEDTARLIRALRDRTAEAFDELAVAADWYPNPVELNAVPMPGPTPSSTASVCADEMADALLRALTDRGLTDWRIERDYVMSARVLVDSAKRMVRLNPVARFRDTDLTSLVAHEIDVHVARAVNGADQPLRIFATGLPGSLLTEEGLAVAAEARVGLLPDGFLARQSAVLRAVELGRQLGFRELYDALRKDTGDNFAWQICLRVKRGLADPAAPGVYAKDTAYARGYRLVSEWLDDGGDLKWLYVGKVGVQHPIADWVAGGWVRLGPVPELWRAQST